MTTPSEKPTWLDRYTMIGDTIPMSRTAGGGGGSNRVFVDFGDTPSYPVSTRFHAFQEPATSGAQNRPHWALAEGLAWLYERELAQPYVQAGTTSGPTAGIPVASSVVYLGELGYTTADMPKVVDLLDGNWDELKDDSVPPNKIIGSDYQVYDSVGSAWVSCYPGGGLPTDTVSAPVSGVGSPDNYSITTSSPLTGSATGVSVVNYDKWLREIRDAGSPEDAFATIVQWTDNQSFKVHRDITAGGLDWTASDTLFVSHFAYVPSLVAAPTIPSGQGYNFALGIHSTLGRLEKNALTSLKVRTAEEVPFDVERYILGGLDAAYDQLGYGTAGGGRAITVDAGAVESQIAVAGQIGYRAWVPTGSYDGTIGFMGQVVGGNEDVRTNYVSGVLLALDDNGGTRITLDNSCTGNAAGGLTLIGASAQFQSGSDFTIFPGLDMLVVYDSGGDPVVVAGSPEGLYIIEDITGASTADLIALDGSTPDLSTANTCSLLRPTFISVPGNLAFEKGATGNKHFGNIFTSYGTGPREAAIELNAYHEHAADNESSHLKTYMNIDRSSPILALGAHHVTGGGADYWCASAVYGAVSPTWVDGSIIEHWVADAQLGSAILNWDYVGGSNGQICQVTFEENLRRMEFRFYPYGESEGMGSGPTASQHTDVIFRLGAGSDDYVRFGATYVDEAGATYPAAGFWVGYRDGAAQTSHFKLKGYPNSPTAPEGTDANTVYHRFEIDENANFGYSGVRTLEKQIDCADAVGSGSWAISFANTKHFWEHPGGATAYIVHPITIPHNCRLDSVTAYLDHGATAMAAQGMLVYVSRWDLSSTGSDYLNLDSDTFDPSGGIEGFTLNSASLPYYPVDLEGEVILVRVVTGLAATRQFYYGCEVKFSYVDIHPD